MSKFVSKKDIAEKTAENILGAPYSIPEWDGCVYIKKWTGLERAAFIEKIQDLYKDKEDITKVEGKHVPELFRLQVEIFIKSVYGEDGKPLYDINSEEDIKEVGNIDADVLQNLFNECASRNGLSDGQVGKDIKNSEPAQSKGSI